MYIVRSGRKLALWLVPLVLSAGLTAAESHVVPLEELRRQAIASEQKRSADLAAISNLLEMEPVRKVMAKGNLDAKQIRLAAQLLDANELARLAARAELVRGDIEAGALNNQQLTYIVIALATAVIILVIVAA